MVLALLMPAMVTGPSDSALSGFLDRSRQVPRMPRPISSGILDLGRIEPPIGRLLVAHDRSCNAVEAERPAVRPGGGTRPRGTSSGGRRGRQPVRHRVRFGRRSCRRSRAGGRGGCTMACSTTAGGRGRPGRVSNRRILAASARSALGVDLAERGQDLLERAPTRVGERGGRVDCDAVAIAATSGRGEVQRWEGVLGVDRVAAATAGGGVDRDPASGGR